MTDPGVATSAPVPWSLRILSCTPWFSPLYSEAAATGFRIRRSIQMDFVARHAEKRIRTALSDTRVVAIVGPRQSGKTTLARRISAGSDRPYVSLDYTQSRRFAQSDPVGFLRGMESATIDEIQRAPDLVLEVKKAVDQDPRPGRFLITGSVDLFSRSVSPDSMAGRVAIVELLPFSQAEVANSRPPSFLDRSVTGEFPSLADVGPTTD